MRLVAADVGRSLIFLLSTGGPAEPLDTTGGSVELGLKNTAIHKSTFYLLLLYLHTYPSG